MSTIRAPLNHSLIPELQSIEVSTSLQLPSIQIVGLPSQEVSEARERVRAAFSASGFEFPKKRVIVNLSPASIKKRGTGLDLPMALGILDASSENRSQEVVAWGELGLDGRLHPAGQELRAVHATWSRGIGRVILPKSALTSEKRQKLLALHRSQAFSHPFPAIQLAHNLPSAWDALHSVKQGVIDWPRRASEIPPSESSTDSPLLRLDPWLERVIGVSSSGGHHLILLGSRGSGKSTALEWLLHLTETPSPEVQAMQLLMEDLSLSPSTQGRALRAPLRRVSSQVKPSALVGSISAGGIRPGEFALAHGGILHADEFPEWSRDSREVLREPLETGWVNLTRTQGSLQFPAQFQLAATGNLCPCGGWDGSQESLRQECRCTPQQRKTYVERLSGPVLDRIDLVARVPAPHRRSFETPQSELFSLPERVARTRAALRSHWNELPGRIAAQTLETILEQRSALKQEIDTLGRQSYRDRHKILRLALTLAAWDGHSEPLAQHILEARAYRDFPLA